jgi:hypothetical protein
MNIKIVTWSLAIFTTVSYLLCIGYSLLTPDSVHMAAFLQTVLPGYAPQSWRGFAAGLVQSFLWGAYIGIVYVPIYNFVNRRFGTVVFAAGSRSR